MLKKLTRSALKFACRRFPQERGKFRILNEIYFGKLAPKHDLWLVDELHLGLKMRLNISEFLQAHLYLFGSYELPTVRFIRRYLREGSVAMDVGAQIGYLTLVMATAANRNTRVISFEPEKVNLERFNENMSLNSVTNVELRRQAVTDSPGTIRLYLSTDHNSGTHSTIANDPNVGTDFEEVPATTIDEASKSIGLERLDLVKIDVEGAEYEVVQGAQGSIASFKPTFIIELSEGIQNSRGFSTIRFKQMMLDYGYQPYLISDKGLLVDTPIEQPHAMDNVVFVHNDRIRSVADHLA